MSTFNYEKYNEIVNAINYLSNKLESIDKNNYKTDEVEEMACQLISVGNSLQAYIRHSRK